MEHSSPQSRILISKWQYKHGSEESEIQRGFCASKMRKERKQHFRLSGLKINQCVARGYSFSKKEWIASQLETRNQTKYKLPLWVDESFAGFSETPLCHHDRFQANYSAVFAGEEQTGKIIFPTFLSFSCCSACSDFPSAHWKESWVPSVLVVRLTSRNAAQKVKVLL